MLTNAVSCNLMGGLGNQLFQIFTTIAYGLRYSRKIIFPYTHKLTIGIERPTYWTSFLKNIVMFTTKNKNYGYSNEKLRETIIVNEITFHYTEIPPFEIPVFSFNGYFQSYLYFETEKKAIFDIIQLSKQKQEIRTEFPELFEKIESSNTRIISMHFRLGDYKQQQSRHPIMPFDYYCNALNIILFNHIQLYNYRVLYLCEKEDNYDVTITINALKDVYPDVEFVKADDAIEDWKQMLIMSNCDDNIIANSSFSWWGAYFNETVDKVVCYPYRWFGPDAINNNTKDLFPPSWKKILF